MDAPIVTSPPFVPSTRAKMNLYILYESGRSAVYGIGTYIRELTEALSNCNVNLCVIYLKSDKLQIQKEKIEGVWHWYFPESIPQHITSVHQKQNELYYRSVVYQLQLYIENKENLVFHLNFNHGGTLIEYIKKTFDCRTVTTIHYLNWCFKLSGNVSRFRKILASGNDELDKTIDKSFKNEKEFFEMPDHIICLSEHTRQILQDDYQIMPNKLSVIHNGLFDSDFTKDKLMLRRKYHIPDIPIILFVGRLDEKKGLTNALRVFKTVLNLQRAHLIIAGNGSFDTFMEECEDIWTHVTWTGRIKKEKLYDLYSVADIGIMPSFTEQCSYVAIEMMMHGVPLIASTSTGLKEMVEDGVTGLHILVEEHSDKVEIDNALMAEKMLYLLQHPDERQRLGANARNRYERLYSSEIFRQNMINFYQSFFIE